MNKQDDNFENIPIDGEKSDINSSNEENKINKNLDIDDYVYIMPKKKRRRTKYKRKKKIQKILLIILISILSLAILSVGTVLVLNQIGKNQLLDSSNIDIQPPSEVQDDAVIEDQGRTIDYKGSTYKYNEDLTNILFMGIDDDILESEGELEGGGQADSIFLVSLDTNTGANNVLAISRDTMEDINIYSNSGEYVGVENEQIALAYAYGDGGKTSCENMVTAVGRLMYGVPINSYFSFELEAIAIVNDAVGGVTVTVDEDVVFSTRTVYAGETVTLTGSEAESYVAGRDIRELDSNVDRMSRQIKYVESFAQAAVQMTMSDLTFPLTLYNTLDDYMYTNLNVSRVSYLATNFIQKGNTGIKVETIEGEVNQGEKYAEFYPDEEKLFEQMLDIFYYKIS